MTTCKIYHPVGGVMNHDCKAAQYEYELVGTINASSLSDAFMKSQNFDPIYESFNKRSTSIGDIIVMEDRDPAIVTSTGFQVVTPHWLTYLDWTNH